MQVPPFCPVIGLLGGWGARTSGLAYLNLLSLTPGLGARGARTLLLSYRKREKPPVT
jgi:hypothetical protein